MPSGKKNYVHFRRNDRRANRNQNRRNNLRNIRRNENQNNQAVRHVREENAQPANIVNEANQPQSRFRFSSPILVEDSRINELIIMSEETD